MSDFESGTTESETSTFADDVQLAHRQIMTAIFSVAQSQRNTIHENELMKMLSNVTAMHSRQSVQQIFSFCEGRNRDQLVFWFAYYGYVKCLKFMYDNGENPHRRSRTLRGLTVVFYVTSTKWKESLNETEALAIFTLVYGLTNPAGNRLVDVNEIFEGETVLHRAIYNGKVQLVRFLLNMDAVVTIKNKYNETAEEMANNGNASVKQVFLDQKFRVFYQNVRENRMTPDGLDQITYDEHKALCDLLVTFKKSCFNDSVNGELIYPTNFSAKGRAIVYGLAKQLSLAVAKRLVEAETDNRLQSVVVSVTHPTAAPPRNTRTESVSTDWVVKEGYESVPEDEALFVNDTLRMIFTSGAVYTFDGDTDEVVQATTLRLHSHTSAQVGKHIHDLIIHHKFVNTLEIGLAFGVSALYALEAHRVNAVGGRHSAIDPYQAKDWGNGGRAHIKMSGLESYFGFLDIPDWIALPTMLAEGSGTVDLIYIDGPHKFDDVMLDVFYCNKLLRVGGILYFDDHHLPSVRRVCSYIYHDMSGLYEPLLTPTFPGTAAFRKVADKDGRTWDHYSSF